MDKTFSTGSTNGRGTVNSTKGMTRYRRADNGALFGEVRQLPPKSRKNQVHQETGRGRQGNKGMVCIKKTKRGNLKKKPHKSTAEGLQGVSCLTSPKISKIHPSPTQKGKKDTSQRGWTGEDVNFSVYATRRGLYL